LKILEDIADVNQSPATDDEISDEVNKKKNSGEDQNEDRRNLQKKYREMV